MNKSLAIGFASLTIALGGCSTGQYTGTWTSTVQEGDFQLGGMTLSSDGTYTAYADYGGDTRGFSGTWTIDSSEDREAIVFWTARPGAKPARYWIERDADDSSVLIVTEPKSGTVTRLTEVTKGDSK